MKKAESDGVSLAFDEGLSALGGMGERSEGLFPHNINLITIM